MLFLVLWPAGRIPNPEGELSLIEEAAKFIWVTLGSEAYFKWVQLTAWTITILAIVFFVLWLVFKFQKRTRKRAIRGPARGEMFCSVDIRPARRRVAATPLRHLLTTIKRPQARTENRASFEYPADEANTAI
jgi:hypothetical protein